MSLQLPFGIKPVNPLSNLDKDRYGPHSSKALALTATIGTREIGLTVGIIENGKIVEYWFEAGITDNDLVPKNVSTTTIIDTADVSVYVPEQQYIAGNTYVTYINPISPIEQFQTEAIYRCIINALEYESPEDAQEKWSYQGTQVVITVDNTSTVFCANATSIRNIIGYVHSDTVVNIQNGRIYYYDSTSIVLDDGLSTIKPSDNIEAGRWVYNGKMISPGIGGSVTYNITTTNATSIFPQTRNYLNISSGLAAVNITLGVSSNVDINNCEYTYYCIVNNTSNTIRSIINISGTAQINWEGQTGNIYAEAGEKVLITFKTQSSNVLFGKCCILDSGDLRNPIVESTIFKKLLEEPAYEEGKVFYDSNKKCLVLFDDITGTNLELSYEIPIRAKNETGSTILNGTPCYINSASNGLPTVDLADCTEYNKSRVIGLATQNVLDGGVGKFIWFGIVRDINTTQYSLGDTLYLRKDYPGEITNIKQTGGLYQVRLGTVTKIGATDGEIQMNVFASETTAEMNSDRGWPDKSLVSLSFNDINRTLYLAPTGSKVRYYQYGIMYNISSILSLSIPNSEGRYFIYINNGTLNYILNPSDSQLKTIIYSYVPVANIYWDATNSRSIYTGSELHNSIGYGLKNHIINHFTVGAKYGSGLGLNNIIINGDGSLASHIQFGIDSGIMYDEDIEHSIPSTISTSGVSRILYHDASGNIRFGTNSGYSILTTGTGRVAYNPSGSSLVEASDGNYVWYHIFTSGNITPNLCSISIPGNDQYTTKQLAYSGLTSDITTVMSLSLPNIEFVPLASMLVQTSSSYTNIVKSRFVDANTIGETFYDWRKSSMSGGSGSGGGISTPSFSDNDFEIYDNLDISKKLKVQVSGVTSSTTRTLIIPDKDGTIALLDDVFTLIIPETSWDGSTYTLSLSSNMFITRTILNGITTIRFALSNLSSIISKELSILVDNSNNTQAISTIIFNTTGGYTWNWGLGSLPNGLAAGAKATLYIYNISATAVKASWEVNG